MHVNLSCIAVLSLLLLFMPSCASAPMIQPQINSFVVAERFNQALRQLENGEKYYGKNNTLLYQLDYALVLHLAKKYRKSIEVFEQAKDSFDLLFTKSITAQAGTWVINDNTAPYRGEDFERVMINVFQALNFAVLDDFNEALVEARDVDSILSVINQQYNLNQKNVYKEDAFARLLMGILYETDATQTGINDAYISYQKALASYENDYKINYEIDVPHLLKENIMAAAMVVRPEELKNYQEKFGNITFPTQEDKEKSAQVYVVHYLGLSPIKHETTIPIPLPGGYFSRLSFPKYSKRIFSSNEGVLKAVSNSGQVFESKTEVGEDIGAIAFQNLNNRKARVIAKALLRPGVKYALENAIDQQIDSRSGSQAFKYLSSLYNLASEKADLRSWQTLPAQIKITRLLLEPGAYDFSFNSQPLGKAELKAGQIKFFVVRTNIEKSHE